MPGHIGKDSKAVTQRLIQVLNVLIVSGRFKSRRQITQKLGVYETQASRWYSGEGACTVDVLVKVVKVLGVDPAWLLMGTGEMFTNADSRLEAIEKQRAMLTENRPVKPGTKTRNSREKSSKKRSFQKKLAL